MESAAPFYPPCRDGPTHRIPLSHCIDCGWVPRDPDAVAKVVVVNEPGVRQVVVPRAKRFKGGEAKRKLTISLGERDGWACFYCTIELVLDGPLSKILTPTQATIDHVVPLVAGGTNAPANLRLACSLCNGKKAGKSMEEYRASPALEERQRYVAGLRVRAMFQNTQEAFHQAEMARRKDVLT